MSVIVTIRARGSERFVYNINNYRCKASGFTLYSCSARTRCAQYVHCTAAAHARVVHSMYTVEL